MIAKRVAQRLAQSNIIPFDPNLGQGIVDLGDPYSLENHAAHVERIKQNGIQELKVQGQSYIDDFKVTGIEFVSGGQRYFYMINMDIKRKDETNPEMKSEIVAMLDETVDL